MTSGERSAAERVDAAMRGAAQSLDLSGLGLKEVPALPPELHGISQLKLSRNRLKAVPDFIYQMDRLEVLDLGCNWLAELPGEIGRLDRMASLDLSENRLIRLPPALFACAELRKLSLYGNQLVSLPRGLTPLENLHRLDVSSNRLASLDDVGVAFPGLRDLDASGNLLENIDKALLTLPALRILNLSANRLTSAKKLAGMSWIVELYLDDNQLEGIPAEIAGFPNLRVFSAANNPCGPLSLAFDRVSASDLKQQVRLAFQAHTVTPDQGKEYFLAPNLCFEFMLAFSGLIAVLRFIDMYFKRPQAAAGTTAVMRFPDGSVIELSHLSRKMTLDLVHQHLDLQPAGKTMIQLNPEPVYQGGHGLNLLVDAVARVPTAELVARAGQGNVTFINGNLVQNISHQEVNEMGDNIRIGSNTGVVNWKTDMKEVTQIVGANGLDEAAKAQIATLIKQLSDALAKAKPAQQLDAEAITEAAQEVVTKATEPNPNKKSVEISGKMLLEAAKAIADAVPIAVEIVKTVSHFLGIC